MRPIQIIQVSEMEILIQDDDEFLMHLQPHRAESAGRDFIGLQDPDAWWMKLVMEYGPEGYCLWLRQEPRSTNGKPMTGSMINPIGRLSEWNDAVSTRLKLANELLAWHVQYVVAWMDEDQAYYGAVHQETGWIKPPNRVAFLIRSGINDREGWQQLIVDARRQARQLDIAFVHNLDPNPD